MGKKEQTLQNSQCIHNEKVQHAKQQKGMTYKQKIIQPKKRRLRNNICNKIIKQNS